MSDHCEMQISNLTDKINDTNEYLESQAEIIEVQNKKILELESMIYGYCHCCKKSLDNDETVFEYCKKCHRYIEIP
jgi:thioredoxin-related protein